MIVTTLGHPRFQKKNSWNSKVPSMKTLIHASLSIPKRTYTIWPSWAQDKLRFRYQIFSRNLPRRYWFLEKSMLHERTSRNQLELLVPHPFKLLYLLFPPEASKSSQKSTVITSSPFLHINRLVSPTSSHPWVVFYTLHLELPRVSGEVFGDLAAGQWGFCLVEELMMQKYLVANMQIYTFSDVMICTWSRYLYHLNVSLYHAPSTS